MRRLGALTVYDGVEEVPPGSGPRAVTIGVFDGVHRGHQALMRTVIERAADAGATPAVVTFDRHPLEVVQPGAEPPLITTLPQRARVMESIGIRELIVLRFDDRLMQMPAETFVEDVLVRRLDCVHVVIGANFRFGHKQSGTIETLNELGPALGFATTIFALQMAGEDAVVSSSLIRRHLTEGRVERVAEELDRPFRVEGVVEHGASRGRDLGFPTANLRVPARMLLPKLGVYAGWVVRTDGRLPAAINVGVNPTFADRTEPVVEVHILDFDQDLYGEVLEVEFTHRLRDERRFEDVSALVAQMRADVEKSRALLGL
ncbi:MAG TPA: bifunctional riboflavin kinase/FAD synthetase [Actinomycetota bacterium]